jgi:acetyltransferase-like isoleucine patch superfamily enzyme
MNTPLVGERLIRRAPIEIEDDCWLGAGVIILPGVKIGRAAVLGAGAVVTRDVAAGDVVGGVPARAIRSLWPDRGAAL